MSRPQPTKKVLEFARQQPGGIIRWSEAEMVYRMESKAARRGHGFMQNISRIFDRHFTKVEGVSGFYVLDETIAPDPTESEGLGV
jgi:hypothetical protein